MGRGGKEELHLLSLRVCCSSNFSPVAVSYARRRHVPRDFQPLQPTLFHTDNLGSLNQNVVRSDGQSWPGDMSKPISISFGKSKTSVAPTPVSIALGRKPTTFTQKPAKAALRHDSDDEDEQGPVAEEVTGFAADGAVLSRPTEQKDAIVIKNAGNGDWRTRGKKNLLPTELQVQREAEAKGEASQVERNEASRASGLQLAKSSTDDITTTGHTNGDNIVSNEHAKEMTEDECALQALLQDGDRERQTNAVIIQAGNARPQGIDETDDFRADVASRPEVPTLDEYAAMPVEEFGLAMLRGMGRKRKANGEIVNYGDNEAKKVPKPREVRQGYLGIGAKAAPGADTELGAWGKADMRKNKKGEGLYTPVMLRDRRTGEMITEDELENRKKEAKLKGKGEEDWRDRRDRNLENSGRDSRNSEQKCITEKDEQLNGLSRSSSSRKGRDEHTSSRSRNDRSRSRERSRRDDDDRRRDRRRDKYRDDDRYDSSSSRKSNHRDRGRDSDRDRDRDRRRDR